MASRRTWCTFALTLCAAWSGCASSDSRPPSSAQAAIDDAERAQTLASLAPPKRARPLIAVLAANAGTETTDFLLPYAVLRQSGVADVLAVATGPGPVTLMPALRVRAQLTTRELDTQHPEGADYVIVPALHQPDDPAVLAWIASQRARGALVIGICSGAKVLSNAGLLRDRAATGHWYDVAGLRSANPTLHWVRDRRFVVDRGVATTTGVTASIPLSLTLVEAIAGRERAETLAREIGVAHWDATHQSDAFALRARHVWTIARNTLAIWGHESLGVRVEPGVDEIALALTADAYSRTYRSHALALSSDLAPVATRRGLELLPDRALDPKSARTALPPVPTSEPALALDRALAGIAERYGEDTADVVALQLEYPNSR